MAGGWARIFFSPRGVARTSAPPPSGHPLTRKLRPVSLARDQGTLRAAGRRLPKPAALGQVWEVSGGSRSGAEAGSLHPGSRCSSLSAGTALGAPGAPEVGRGLAARPGWGVGPQFPSQAL